MSLAEIHDHFREGAPLPPRAVHVSFDDGFASTMVAAEILAEHRVPWTLFVVVDSVLDGYRPWFVRLANALGVTAYIRRRDGSIVDTSTPAAKWSIARELKAQIMATPAALHEEVVDEVLSLPGMQTPHQDRWTLLNMNDVRELLNAGVEIGNHSARHLNLNRCAPETLHAEIEGSRRRLEVALESPVRWFSYPDGRRTTRVERVAALGHDLATSVWRPGARLRPFAIPRRAGGAGGLDEALGGRAALASSMDWVRTEAPIKAWELRHRFVERVVSRER